MSPAPLLIALLLTTPALAQTPAPAPAPAPAQPAAPAPDSWLTRTTADLILLDKLRTQPTALSVKVGQSVTFGTLTITLRNCVTRPPDAAQNAGAFLEIQDSAGSAPVFKGWIFSATPAVAQFEHPVYDLRLANCR